MPIRVLRLGFSLTAIALLAGAGARHTAAQALQVGAVFPDFSEPDMNTRQPIRLESFRGKVVLVDFWATWCMPCVAELPNVKKAYNKYHSQGFEIISVSLDPNVEVCQGFVKRNQLPWHHICDGKFWNAKLAKKHKVTGIPLPVLVGKDGKIVSTTARGEDLLRAIENALKAKYEPPASAPAEQPQARLAAADKLRDAGQYAEALKIYDELGGRYADGEVGRAAQERARVLRATPEVVKKIEADKQAAYEQEAASASAPWLKSARELAEARNYPAARENYRKIIEKYPNSKVAQTAADELKKLPEG